MLKGQFTSKIVSVGSRGGHSEVSVGLEDVNCIVCLVVAVGAELVNASVV